MTEDRKKQVYDNGHCQVVVELFPAKEEEKRTVFPATLTRYEYCLRENIRPFATVFVFAKDLLAGHHWVSHVFPGNEQVTKTTGKLWWKKTIVVSEITQEERLEQLIVERIKFADRHFEEFKAKISAGNEAIKGSLHLISAIKEVGKIAGGGDE